MYLVLLRYEREEAFLALNLTVKNATLQDSLDQFVKGELLEGDNAYFCDKCGEKVRVPTRTFLYVQIKYINNYNTFKVFIYWYR